MACRRASSAGEAGISAPIVKALLGGITTCGMLA
jgi:hypothetical protein